MENCRVRRRRAGRKSQTQYENKANEPHRSLPPARFARSLAESKGCQGPGWIIYWPYQPAIARRTPSVVYGEGRGPWQVKHVVFGGAPLEVLTVKLLGDSVFSTSALVPGLLQLADYGVESGKMVKLEEAQIHSVEIVADHIGVIARPERVLKFAVLGGVFCHKAVVLLAGNHTYVLVHQHKCDAGRPRTSAPRGKKGTIADVLMGLRDVRHCRSCLRSEVGQGADVNTQQSECLTDSLVHMTPIVIRSRTDQQVRDRTPAMRGR